MNLLKLLDFPESTKRLAESLWRDNPNSAMSVEPNGTTETGEKKFKIFLASKEQRLTSLVQVTDLTVTQIDTKRSGQYAKTVIEVIENPSKSPSTL